MTAALCIDLGGTRPARLARVVEAGREAEGSGNWATGLRPRTSRISAIASLD